MIVRIVRPCHIFGVLRAAGEVVDVEADLGLRLAAAGYAVVGEPQNEHEREQKIVDDIENATAPPASEATLSKRGRRR